MGKPSISMGFENRTTCCMRPPFDLPPVPRRAACLLALGTPERFSPSLSIREPIASRGRGRGSENPPRALSELEQRRPAPRCIYSAGERSLSRADALFLRFIVLRLIISNESSSVGDKLRRMIFVPEASRIPEELWCMDLG